MTQTLDVVVLGGGTGGYVAAIRAAQLGLSVAVIEKDKLGGTCLHRGCIPSKAMLQSASVYAECQKAASFGIETGEISFNFSKIAQRKEAIVAQLYGGVQQLLKKYRVRIVNGTGRLMGPSIFSPTSGAISVEMDNGKQEVLTPTSVIIATGSRPRGIPGIAIDGDAVVTSDHLVNATAVPASIVIVGGGAIGVEWASMFSDFGVKVTLIETEERILPREDEDVSRKLHRTLAERGVVIYTKALLRKAGRTQNGSVIARIAVNGEEMDIETEKVLISAGRIPNVDDIGLDATQVRRDNGFIEVDGRMRTAEKNIYAIGDVVAGLQLAHVAARQGVIAAEAISGLRPTPLNERFVARCTYSRPEIGAVGLTESEARNLGHTVKVGTFPLSALGKAHIHGDTDGFAKIVADADSDDVLGVHLVGARATDLVSEAGLALLLQASVWELGLTVRPHPSFAEALSEAVLAADGIAIHI